MRAILCISAVLLALFAATGCGEKADNSDPINNGATGLVWDQGSWDQTNWQ